MSSPATATHYACHVVEFAGGRPPEQTILNQCLDYLGSADAQTEFWLVGDTQEHTRAHYDAFHSHDAALRFACLDLATEQTPELDTGLLRPHAAEILLLHEGAAKLGTEQWHLLRQL